jgi:4-hydroxy-4-methyl-2-oxoglutarate aldolase
MQLPPGPKQLEALKTFGVPALCNAIEFLNLRMKNEGFTDSSIASLTCKNSTTIGHAIPITIKSSSPPMTAEAYVEKTKWWDTILETATPRIVVIQDISPNTARGALIGGVHANILKALECVGVMTNGAVRDLEQLETLGMASWAGSTSPSHAYAHIVSIGEPVVVAGLRISRGDLLMGDGHGVCSVPVNDLDRLIEILDRMAKAEGEIVQFCQSTQFNVSDLKSLIRRLRDEKF